MEMILVEFMVKFIFEHNSDKGKNLKTQNTKSVPLD
jgi:hypothetical protein